jgi:hypothetical protein
MPTKPGRIETYTQIKRHKIQYSISAYTFPRETHIQHVRFDDQYIHFELTDGRVLSIPLWWIPTVYNASPEERIKYEISRDRTMVIWDPNKCAINDEVRILDFMVPPRQTKLTAEKKAEYRTRSTSRKRNTNK